jgi:Flp pilus assembly protein TadD
LIASRQQDFGQAKAWYNQALARFRQKETLSHQQTRWLIQLYNGLGSVYSQQGEFDRARQCHQEVLALSCQTDKRSGEAQANWRQIGELTVSSA